jgi:DNA (cytosine-5)-methyltransferase 1
MLSKLSLFSGIGGDDLASEWAGITTVCHSEINPFCQQVLKKHWPNIPIIGDVHDVTKEKIKEVTGLERIDIISGGFPCQPVSKAGQRRGKEDDRWLWPEMFRIIREIKPTWVVGENVDGLVNMGIKDILLELESIGYRSQSFLIPACAVGAIGIRNRIFIIAYSGSDFSTFRIFNRDGNQTEEWNNNSEIRCEDREFLKVASIPNRGILSEAWEFREPKLVRKDNGISFTLDRIRALGNAVVPQQVYPFYKAIVDIKNLNKVTGNKVQEAIQRKPIA